MSGYFQFEFNPQLSDSLIHTLNKPYKGAKRFDVGAPDAAGTLRVWARSEKELRDHILNAIFDIIFQKSRCGAVVDNPACIYCGHRTESRGRNRSGTRTWRCLNLECRRSFVLDRSFRGGVNHPSHSKKPDFYRLVFVEGKMVQEAADLLKISHDAADNWFHKMAALNRGKDLRCPCGKELRHRGSCKYRMLYAKLRRHEISREKLGEITRERRDDTFQLSKPRKDQAVAAMSQSQAAGAC